MLNRLNLPKTNQSDGQAKQKKAQIHFKKLLFAGRNGLNIPVTPAGIDTEIEPLPHQCSSQVAVWSAESPLCMRPDHPSPAVTELTTESHLDPGGRHRGSSGSL